MCVACGDPAHVAATSLVANAALENKPTFSLGQIIDQLRTQWMGTEEGKYRAWPGTNVSYSMPDSYPTNAPYSETGLSIMSAVMKDTARLSFELWDDAIALNLFESFNNPGANITLNWASGTDLNGTYAQYAVGNTPSNGYYPIQPAQIWLNNTWPELDQDSDLFYGARGVAIYLHEIGHTLGLSHPGSYNAGSGETITYANNAEFAQDNRQYTVMSYFGGYDPSTHSWTQDGGDRGWYYPSTPMVFDIAAIQATYGADFTTRSGNSTYGFNITADVAARSANGLAVYGFAQNAHPIFTIWDGGGTDTLDCSGYAQGQTIDLQPGNYSSIGGLAGNIAIAYGCTIENAVGGSGGDWLVGNAANNVLTGLGGDDTAAFSQGFASYAVADFGWHGRIEVSGPDGSDTLYTIERLRFADGTVNLNDGNAVFDPLFYDRTYRDVFRANFDAMTHYNAFGWREGRDPNPYFDTSWYLAVNPDVRAAGMNPLTHYELTGWREGRDPGPNFDVRLYLKNNPDVAAAGMDPLTHYLNAGRLEGRATHAAIGTASFGFDPQYYLATNPDVAAAGVEPLVHFNAFGWREGRNPNALFDTKGYLAHYTDVRAAGINPLQHYESFGWREGRDPSAAFDTLVYLHTYPDIAAAHVNPLDHYLNNGIYEGRSTFGDGIWH